MRSKSGQRNKMIIRDLFSVDHEGWSDFGKRAIEQ
jgi:hypothetical protein